MDDHLFYEFKNEIQFSNIIFVSLDDYKNVYMPANDSIQRRA